MTLGPSSSAIYIQNAPQANHAPTPPRPTALTVHPTALFSILDHYLRRTDQQPRVIGTLLGTRPSPSTVNVTHAFAVLHSETEEQVAVDMDYHRSMFDMFVRGRGEGNKEPIGIVGWYATGGEEKQVARPHGQPQGQGQKGLGTYSALIHNFYGQETAPYPAVHVSLDTGTEEGVGAGVRAYVGSPIGVSPKPENCVFVPIRCEFALHDSERAGLDLLLDSASSVTGVTTPNTQLATLHDALLSTSSALSRVLVYVQGVLLGTTPPDPAVGRYLWNVLGTIPDEEGGWSTSLQDTVMVSYLANLVRSQAEVAARLAMVSGA